MNNKPTNNNLRQAVLTLIAVLTTCATVWAQDLSDLFEYSELPTVTGGQSSNWSSTENYQMLVDGNTYQLVKLPLPDAMFDEISRLPATYANFLITNHQVLVPVYGQAENDVKACRLIGEAFPGRDIVAIDCRALVCQHGSLHCATMQLPRGTLASSQHNQ